MDQKPKTLVVGMLTRKESFRVRSGNESELLSDTLFDFLHAVCKGSGKKLKRPHGKLWDVQFYVQRETSSSHNDSVDYEVPYNVAEALLDLRKGLEKGLKDLYKHGQESGQNLLVQLNKGEITLDQFDNH